MNIWDITVILVSAMLASGAGIALMSRGRARPGSDADTAGPELAFLFRDCDLEHATPAGHALLSAFSAGADTDWHRLRTSLTDRFPDLPQPEDLPDLETLTVAAKDDADRGRVQIRRSNEMLAVEIIDEDTVDAHTVHTIRTLQARNDILELAAGVSPFPIWLLDRQGDVIWYNPSYAALIQQDPCQDAKKSLFEIPSLDHSNSGSARASLTSRVDGREMWYDVSISKRGDKTICHATDINAVIRAEVAQRNFVQTLAKTFAQLSIGLAIFDRNRQLALFNPALVDLTLLPVEFLSGRPQLLSFFDRLRDNRVMPEPKNYMSWRHEISDVIAAASNGSYQETWTLESGHTYRVSGRPHPDGAVAFLIEDITAEVSLTRNFRAELELGQSMMDAVDDALVVFSATGVLTFCNAAYRNMWKMDPDVSFADITIIDAQKVWQDRCTPDPSWADIRDFVQRMGDRTQWETRVRQIDGRALDIQLTPIVAGATLIRFSQKASAGAEAVSA